MAVLLLAIALVGVQVLIGGTRLLFSLPGYAIVALAGILALVSLRRAKPAPDAIALVSTTVFAAYVIGRALLSPAPYVARTDLYIVLGALIVYGFTATIFTDTKSRMILICFLLVVGVVHSFVGAIQFRNGDNFMPIPFLQRADYGQRASGFYVCPNHLAGLLEVLGIFGIAIVCWSRIPVWGKLLIAYVTGVCYLGAILTGSRGGYLSIGASIAVFVLLSLLVLRRGGGSIGWKVAGASLVVAVIAGAFVYFSVSKNPLLSKRASKIADVSDIRFDLWQAAIEQWKIDPVWGTGAATYRYYGRKFRTERMQRDPIEVHNDYLQLLAEYGLVGVVAFGAFMVFHMRAGWRGFQRLGPKRVAVASRLSSNKLALHLGASAAVAAYVVHSVFDFNLHIPANALLLALVFGMIANPGLQGATEPARPKAGFLFARLAVSLLGIVVLVQTVRLLPGEYYAELARKSLRDEKLGSALRYGLQGLSCERSNPELYATLGRARLGFGYDARDRAVQASYYRAAAKDFETARDLAPLDQRFPITLGLLYDLLGRFDDAERALQLAMTLDPRSTYVRQYYDAHVQRWKEATEASAAPAANTETAEPGAAP